MNSETLRTRNISRRNDIEISDWNIIESVIFTQLFFFRTSVYDFQGLFRPFIICRHRHGQCYKKPTGLFILHSVFNLRNSNGENYSKNHKIYRNKVYITEYIFVFVCDYIYIYIHLLFCLRFVGHQDNPVTHPILQPSISAARAFQSSPPFSASTSFLITYSHLNLSLPVVFYHWKTFFFYNWVLVYNYLYECELFLASNRMSSPLKSSVSDYA